MYGFTLLKLLLTKWMIYRNVRFVNLPCKPKGLARVVAHGGPSGAGKPQLTGISDFNSVIETMEKAALTFYAITCGHVLARAHARSGDAAMIAGYLGNSGVFEEAVADFATACARPERPRPSGL